MSFKDALVSFLVRCSSIVIALAVLLLLLQLVASRLQDGSLGDSAISIMMLGALLWSIIMITTQAAQPLNDWLDRAKNGQDY